MWSPEAPVPDDRVRCRVVLSGRVQGVGFRFYAVRQARNLGVGGFVRNLPDGRVETEVEGPRAAGEAFIERLRLGPSGAAVRDLQVNWIAPEGGGGFRLGGGLGRG